MYRLLIIPLVMIYCWALFGVSIPVERNKASLILIIEAMLDHRQQEAREKADELIEVDGWTWAVFIVEDSAEAQKVQRYYYGENLP